MDLAKEKSGPGWRKCTKSALVEIDVQNTEEQRGQFVCFFFSWGGGGSGRGGCFFLVDSGTTLMAALLSGLMRWKGTRA